MEWIESIIRFILEVDKELAQIVAQYGAWAYVVIFTVIFVETGVVIAPFLPGDSLLFAAGAIAAQGSLYLGWLFALLCFAAITGDTVNYWIGNKIGQKVFQDEGSRWLNKRHLEKTHRYFEKYGGMTIIIARFVPIVRTVAPFVAGVGKMTYWRFLSYNVIGGLLWVSLFLFGGYFFGSLQFVKEHFGVVVVAIIVLSLVPAGVELLRQIKKPETGSG